MQSEKSWEEGSRQTGCPGQAGIIKRMNQETFSLIKFNQVCLSVLTLKYICQNRKTGFWIQDGTVLNFNTFCVIFILSTNSMRFSKSLRSAELHISSPIKRM